MGLCYHLGSHYQWRGENWGRWVWGRRLILQKPCRCSASTPCPASSVLFLILSLSAVMFIALVLLMATILQTLCSGFPGTDVVVFLESFVNFLEPRVVVFLELLVVVFLEPRVVVSLEPRVVVFLEPRVVVF